MSSNKTFHSRRKTYFKILWLLFLLGLWLYIFLQANMFFTKQKIADQQIILDSQNEELAWFKTATWYIKLNAVRELESNTDNMAWSERISKIIEMLNDLKRIVPNQSWSIQLSDFRVNLDTVSLRWEVSSLLLLYYSDPTKNIVSLFDRFEKLDFIEDIQVKSYTRTDTAFDFVLEAKVINDGNTK